MRRSVVGAAAAVAGVLLLAGCAGDSEAAQAAYDTCAEDDRTGSLWLKDSSVSAELEWDTGKLECLLEVTGSPYSAVSIVDGDEWEGWTYSTEEDPDSGVSGRFTPR
ncbi:hypothetical protein [Herbiconiux liukaitaii]|uniref:hypothetical protein n=1 Tax=Herbiconiux liukaitaii TaxID=3342799 RepID=UPI0035BA8406